jgi:hypothetical protein
MNRDFFAILCGKLLGDGSLSRKKHARLQFRHSKNDYGYTVDQLKLFSQYLDFGPNDPLKYRYNDKRTQKTYTTFICQSVTDPTLTETMRLWYPSNRQKVIPKEFVKEYFNEESLAIWYQDDGCLKSESRIILSCECFSNGEINFLRKLIYEKFLIQSSIDSQRRIDICNRKDVELFLNYVTPYLSDCMQRKSLRNYHNMLTIKNQELIPTSESILSKRTTIYLPVYIKTKIQEHKSPSQKINSCIHMQKEMNNIEDLIYRRKRIIESKKESLKNSDRVPYTIYLSKMNYQGLKILKQWTGIEVSEYIFIFLKDSKVI